MSWDWQVFCEDTMSRTAVQGCFGKGGDITYLDWMLSAWGWTVSVSLLSLLLALVLGYASWHLVEKHGIALGQRAHAWWSHRRGARGR